ncbi:HlyD family secretion protein [Hymenobacter properus]|uniref:HlyD family efflux transporter periplasmic adaptor subunit n=1 Tax=Hymenobacter properus TaxID=2791026 RepID=A0A931BFL5_9BACT|nr:HlyD family efflux transporter periplasmic adaptor subunit [Hymenobacter properus]MBF9143015.1 HlyD family efflux transporter periplasmic adaptor subunit [Hymenobacter properus]MBR7721823.1 HlyD family efflux transporter periplasmic adaptor subunit [Microvirga sp. SRT04]
MLNLSNQHVAEWVWEKIPRKSRPELLRINGSQRMSRILLVVAVLFIIALFLPWRQTISGTGTLTALTPQDRPQTVQNQIAGRIEHWNVREGQFVHKGDTLLTVSEIKDEYFDPNLPERLREQLAAKVANVAAYDAKIAATDQQIAALGTTLQVQLESARNKVEQAENYLNIDRADQVAATNYYETSRARLARYEKGYKNGLFSLTDIETRRLKLQEDLAKVTAARNKVASSQQALANARIELSNLRAKYAQDLAKAQSDRSSAVSSRASSEGEVATTRNKISNVEVRRSLYVVRAPQTGYVVRAFKAGIGETIKEGESIATLQPEAPLLAAEIYVRAMDVPLIQRGRQVRLQFDGWPAIQFSGWPSAAVGTFGGFVSVIDVVSSGSGKYRLLVRPAQPQSGDKPWPRQLRLGSGVQGWVILDSVPVWYEIWRQLNGFPPTLAAEPDEAPVKGDKGK